MTSRFCTGCGARAIQGSSFCTQCGKPVVETAPADGAAKADAPVQVGQAPAPKSSSWFVAAQPSSEQELSPAAPVISARTTTSDMSELIANATPIKDRETQVHDSVFSTSPAYERASHGKFWVLPALLAVVCLSVIVAAGFWWRNSHTKPASALYSSAGDAVRPGTPPIASTDALINGKPSAAKLIPEDRTETRNPEDEHAQPAVAPSTSVVDERHPVVGKFGSAQMATSIPETLPLVPNDARNKPQPPQPESAPAPETSGILHYSGPPVQYGETVTFFNLPPARLRFTFDHKSWQPLISRQRDGTQKLTLRSLSQREQTSCDVSWEIVN